MNFLAHYLYGEMGLVSHQIVHVDRQNHTVTFSPYEKETALTRFCDGILWTTNELFENQKQAVLERLKSGPATSISELAAYISEENFLKPFSIPPITHLYTIEPQEGEIVLQEVIKL